MSNRNRTVLPALNDLAMNIREGRLSLTQALARLDTADEGTLASRLQEALQNLHKHVAEHASDLQFRHAFLELGTAAARKVDSANGLLNFGLNLGGLLCMELDEIDRGLGLMEQALQQIEVVPLKPVEMALVILEVADAYMTFHQRLGPDYLQAAEACYRTVLRLPGAQAFEPRLIARAESGIGLCLADQMQDGHMPRADEAIEHYRKALQHIDATSDPHIYSLVMHNLGNAYSLRTEGERAANLNAAAECLRSALEVRERTGPSQKVRYTSSILAEVEGELGHPFQAIALFEHALETLDPIRERREFSRLHLRLAAHSFRAPHLTWGAIDHLKKVARAGYVVAREAADPDQDTDLWAAASTGLAMVWQEAGRIDDALGLQAEVLARLDPKKFSHRCAVIALDYVQLLALRFEQSLQQNDLEHARRDRDTARKAATLVQNGEIEPHRKLFISASLELMDELLALDEAERSLHLWRQHDLLTEALASVPAAMSRQEIETMLKRLISVSSKLNLMSEVLPIVRQRLAQEQAFLSMKPSLVDYYIYCNEMRMNWDILVKDDLNNHQTESAFLNSDRARSRSLDLISTATAYRLAHKSESNSDSYLPDEYRLQHAEYVREWLANRDEDDYDSSLRRDALAPWLRESILQAAIWRGQWVFGTGPSQVEPEPNEVMFQDIPTAVIEFWCSDDRACAFVRMPNNVELEVVELPGLVAPRQLEWIQEWFALYGGVESLGPVAIPKWAEYMRRLSIEMGVACWRPLSRILEARPVERLMIIPDLWLGSLPIHAMTILGSTNEYLCDRYEIGFCPSFRQLGRACKKGGAVPSTALFIGNPQAKCPTGTCRGKCVLELPLAETELAALRLWWPEVKAMMGSECTPEAVLGRLADLHPGLLHVSTHGLTSFEDPLGSGLVLAYNGVPSEDPLTQYINEELTLTWGSNTHGEVLSLDTLLRRADLRECSLAMLNACEVGLNYFGAPRESLNLASGFLAAGVPTVISPLWPIAEAPASLLTKQFYSELHKDPKHKLKALMRAQRWLRSLDYSQAVELVTERQLKAGISLSGPEKPFSHMFFWASYHLVGSPL